MSVSAGQPPCPRLWTDSYSRFCQILSDTKELQKEINSLSGKLDRTFAVTDELVFKVWSWLASGRRVEVGLGWCLPRLNPLGTLLLGPSFALWSGKAR